MNGIIIKNFTISICSPDQIVSTAFDSLCLMAVSCEYANTVALCDNNGNYLNEYLNISSPPYVTGIDLNGRFVVMTRYSLDIYLFTYNK